MSIFGRNIKHLRQSQGLSQQQFANLFELSRGSVGSYEEGRADPKIETLVKIAQYYQLSLDQLVLGNLGEMKKKEELIREEPKTKDLPYIEDRISDLENRFTRLEQQMKEKP